MRITFISPANLSGGCRVVAIYADRLAQRGHQVSVVATGPRPPTSLRRRALQLFTAGRAAHADSHFDHLGISYQHVPQPFPPGGGECVPSADVVVATWWRTAEWVAGMGPEKGAKVYFIQHHEVHRPETRERVKATLKLPFHKITISHWLIDLLRDVYGDADAQRVPNSVDMQQFHAPARGKRAKPTVGLLYSHKHFKGLDISLKALAAVRAELPELQVVMFGEKPPPEDQLPANTSFTASPDQDQIRHLYARCDVWLCGSRAEGFHLPPLEAMACRCPVVSTRVGGPLDIIEPGENGYLADVEDADALAASLLDVLRSPEQRWRRMSDAAYATAVNYSWDDATDLFEAGLQRAIQASGSLQQQQEAADVVS